MGQLVSPWDSSCHHGTAHVTMEQLVSPWDSSCHHGTARVTMEQLVSPWNSSCHHGTAHVTMEQLVSPWDSSCHHGTARVTMGQLMSPWNSLCHHGTAQNTNIGLCNVFKNSLNTPHIHHSTARASTLLVLTWLGNGIIAYTNCCFQCVVNSVSCYRQCWEHRALVCGLSVQYQTPACGISSVSDPCMWYQFSIRPLRGVSVQYQTPACGIS